MSADSTASNASSGSIRTETPTPINDMGEFEVSIKEWVAVNDKKTELKNQLKELDKQQKSLTPTICNFMERQQCQNSHVQLRDSRLSYAVERTQTSMTQKFIHEGLVSYFRNVHHNEHAEQIATECMDHIKSLRKTETKATLKRVYAKE